MSRRKPLAGAAWFYAQGQRAQSLGYPRALVDGKAKAWPTWAFKAWLLGWMYGYPLAAARQYSTKAKGGAG